MTTAPIDPDDFFGEVDAPANDRSAAVPPHDLDAEAAVLSACLLQSTPSGSDESALEKVRGRLGPEHFFAGRHAWIFRACIALADAGRPHDVVGVLGWLSDHDRLQQVGGNAYLTDVLNATPAVTNVLAHAERVLEKAQARRAIDVAARFSAKVQTSGSVSSAVASAIAELSALSGSDLTRKEAGPSVSSLLEWARTVRSRPEVTRLATGFATLDESCRGGFRFGTLVGVGGAPGAGKTAMVVQWGHRWALAGVPVAMVCSDEGIDDVAMRLALHEGLDPGKLEERDSKEWDALEERLALLPTLHLLDADEGHTLGTAAAHLASAHPGKPGVIIGDSTQTLAGTLGDDDRRARVDRVLQVAKAIARTGALVVLTSELARGAYRSKATAENVEPLAAFKESGGIEYACQTALVLRSLPKGDGVVAVDVPKNRGGLKKGFSIEIDASTRVRECRAPEEASEGEATSRNVAKVERDAIDVLRIVAAHPGIGARELRAKIAGAGLGIGKDRLDAAAARLIDTGRLRNEAEAKGAKVFPHYFAVALTDRKEAS
jgi:replicative DNA helicase